MCPYYIFVWHTYYVLCPVVFAYIYICLSGQLFDPVVWNELWEHSILDNIIINMISIELYM